ncbi:MAG: ROK family protein [Actinomycetota bacterium]
MATVDAATGPSGIVTLLDRLSPPDTAPVVVGLPGRIDYGEGALETGVNLPAGWVPQFRSAALEQQLGRPVHLANDADMAAVGEAWFGAGRDHDDVLYVTISTGVGAGLVLGRRLVAGRRSAAELGHTVIDADGTMGPGPQTVESLGSGTALGRAASARGLPSGADLIDRVRAGDGDAAAVWEAAIGAAAIGIANMCWIAAPTAVVVGGGMGRNGDLVLQPVRRAIAEVGPADLHETIAVVEAALGDDAGLAGAAGWLEARGLT